MSEHRVPTFYFQAAMVSFTAYCVLFTYYTFYRLRDWGPPKCWGPLAVAQSAPHLIRQCREAWFHQCFCSNATVSN